MDSTWFKLVGSKHTFNTIITFPNNIFYYDHISAYETGETMWAKTASNV